MDVNNLSNFYKEFSYGDNKFEFLMQFYEELSNMLNDVIDQFINNIIVPDTGIYHYIPIQLISVGDSTYDINSILVDPDIINAYNLASMTLPQRIAYWNNEMPIAHKIAILDSKKKYIYLTTTRQGNLDQRNYEVIDFTLHTIKGKTLIRNVDYAYNSNKIYLIKNISNYYNDNSSLILKNIAIDYHQVEKAIGTKVFTPYSDVITKNEYRDIVQTLLYVGLGGPMLKNLNETLNTLIGSGQFKIIDQASATDHYKTFWDQSIRGDRALNRFDFLIMSPPDVVTDANVLSIITNYLKKIKLSHTDFFISPYIDITESYRMNQLPELFEYKTIFHMIERIKASNKISLRQKKNLKDIFHSHDNVLIAQAKEFFDQYKMKELSHDFHLGFAFTHLDPLTIHSEKTYFIQQMHHKETIRYIEDFLLQQTRRLRDQITGNSSKKFVVNVNLLNPSKNSDKINAYEQTQRDISANMVDAKLNLGDLILYDNGLAYDVDEINNLYYDHAENAKITNESYYDTIVLKLIPKSAL